MFGPQSFTSEEHPCVCWIALISTLTLFCLVLNVLCMDSYLHESLVSVICMLWSQFLQSLSFSCLEMCCDVTAVYASVLLLEFNFMSVSELLSKKKRGGKRRWSSGDIMKLRIKTEWNKNRVLLVKQLLIRLMQFLLSARGLISQCYNNFQGLYWSN